MPIQVKIFLISVIIGFLSGLFFKAADKINYEKTATVFAVFATASILSAIVSLIWTIIVA